MALRAGDSFDLPSMVHRYLDGELSPADKLALTEMLRSRDDARSEFVRCLLQQVRLEEILARRQSEAARQTSGKPLPAPSRSVGPGLPSETTVDGESAQDPPGHPALDFISKLLAPDRGNLNFPLLLSLLAIAALCGAGLATWLLDRSDAGRPKPVDAWVANERGFNDASPRSLPYVATLVNLTNCRWERDGGAIDFDQQCLQPGQSLQLLEGVAEINSIRPSGSRCTFQLEGPLSMTLTRDGMPSLLYGKLAGMFSGDSDQFAIETPLGRIVVQYDASLGVSSTAHTIELHVFEGEAYVEPLYALADDVSRDELRAGSGTSLRVTISGDSQISVQRGEAQPAHFISQVSMAANRIEISDHYVSTVREAQPVAYWRFEGSSNGFVRNEMSDRFHCRLYGDGLRWSSYLGNTTAEFGSTPRNSCLLSDDVLDGVIHDCYSLEAWVKPSHFHLGAIISLTEIPPRTQAIVRPRTGMLLELCGPVMARSSTSGSWANNPGRIRFLHRNPPGSFTGTSVFSESNYVPRKWQHIVTVKEGPELRLYVDGKLAGTANDPTELPSQMRVLIGQLHPHHSQQVVAVRPFVGELDEVALYDRALQSDEISAHFRAAVPPARLRAPASIDF